MTSVLNEICEWANTTLHYWEQFVLDGLISGQPLTVNFYNTCLNYLMQDYGLLENSEQRPEIRFLKHLDQPVISKLKRPKLKSIHSLENVNALAPNQRITFSDTLTIIYGLNGSGKSGYARVLGCAGYTRGDSDILGDMISSDKVSKPAVATIEIEDEDNGVRSFQFDSNKLPELRGFYAFDSTKPVFERRPTVG